MTESRKIGEFILEQLARADAPARLSRLVCAHIVRGNKIGDEIRAVTVPEEPDEDWISATSTKVVEQAASEAVTLAAGVQRYAVQAYFGSEEKPRGRHVFTCAGADEADDAIGTEGPDAEGLTAQAMRHAEFFAQLSGRTGMQQLKGAHEEIAQLRKENQELRAERLRSLKMIEEIATANAERQASERREIAKAKFWEQSLEKVSLLLPSAINHAAGRTVIPEATGNLLLVKTFVDSITPDELARLGGLLGPERLALLIKVATSVSRTADDKPPGERSDLTGRLAHLVADAATGANGAAS